MSRPGVGLEFSDRMAGPFALGETDPQHGVRAGRAAGSVLTLHSRVYIADLGQFVADPVHAAALEGSVHFAALGGDAPISHGTVGLFTPTSDPDVKLMIYRASCSVAGQDYYFHGVKTVRRAWMFAGWRATTTLECRVHEGPGPDGRVIGVGILRLSPLNFVAQLVSFRARGARSLVDGIAARATFLRFFASELIDTYMRRAPKR